MAAAVEHSEFALGGFAAFEFAREQGANRIEADFSISSLAAVAFASQIFKFAGFAAAGSATPDLRASTVKHAVLSSAGLATPSMLAQARILASFNAPGAATPNLLGGMARWARFESYSYADVTFVLLELPGFDIDGGTTILFFSSAAANTVAAISGAATPDIKGVALANTEAQAVASAASFIAAGAFANGQASISGSAVPNMAAQAVRTCAFVAAGLAAFNAIAQARANARTTIDGRATVDARGGMYSWSTMEAAAQAQAHFSAVHVRLASTDIIASTAMDWRVGRTVFRFLTPSIDVAVHPYEDRVSIRPQEIRVAVRPADLRETQWN